MYSSGSLPAPFSPHLLLRQHHDRFFVIFFFLSFLMYITTSFVADGISLAIMLISDPFAKAGNERVHVRSISAKVTDG